MPAVNADRHLLLGQVRSRSIGSATVTATGAMWLAVLADHHKGKLSHKRQDDSAISDRLLAPEWAADS
jgi:hypothetical protein